jgi:hypothetical protein
MFALGVGQSKLSSVKGERVSDAEDEDGVSGANARPKGLRAISIGFAV